MIPWFSIAPLLACTTDEAVIEPELVVETDTGESIPPLSMTPRDPIPRPLDEGRDEGEGEACRFVSPESGMSTSAGEPLYFDGQVNLWHWDVSDWLTVSWYSDRDEFLDESWPDTSGTFRLYTDSLSAGTHTISFIVENQDGVSCTDEVTHTILSNAVDEASATEAL